MNELATNILVQASTDDQLTAMWLHGRATNTQRAYKNDVDAFVAVIQRPLGLIGLADLQNYADGLNTSQASRCRTLAAIKSLFSFAFRLGYVQFDVARVMKLPKQPSKLAQRILSEPQAMNLIEGTGRNHLIVLFLYATGIRVSELCSLRWSDIQERGEEAIATVTGKGDKTRSIVIPSGVYRQLLSIKHGLFPSDAPIFGLKENQVRRIVKQEARLHGIAGVSPHWLRHSHATHALENGAPIHLVSATLGHSSIATTGKYLHARPAESSGRFLKL